MTGFAPMPIIVGAPRSGTTLLRFMLDTHPELAIPPETGFLVTDPSLADDGGADLPRRFLDWITGFPRGAPAWDDFGIPAAAFERSLLALAPFTVADGFRLFYRTYASRFGKQRYGDKTPMYCRHLPALARLLPEARFIHVIRDGRDVAQSLRRMWFSPGDDMATLARTWVRDVTTARADGAACPHYLEVRYETLVRAPTTVLTTVCDFLDLDFDGDMLHYYRRTPARLAEHRSRYRSDGTLLVDHARRLQQQAMTTRPPDPGRVDGGRHLAPRDAQRFLSVAGELLETLGYRDPRRGQLA